MILSKLATAVCVLACCTTSTAWSSSDYSKVAKEAISNTEKTVTDEGRRRLFSQAVFLGCSSAILPQVSNAAGQVYVPPANAVDKKVIVITGGNTGLGLESAKRLAAAGGQVVLTSRSVEKGEAAVRAVQEYLKDLPDQSLSATAGSVMALPLDLCDFESVKTFPQRYQKAVGEKPIDVLMNNAGVMALPQRMLTKDGYETTFQTNHLGHFLLTSKLLPLLSSDGRVINVSSSAWQIASKGLDMDNLNGEKQYGPWISYGQSKLENILFTRELQRRLEQSNKYSGVSAFSLHPGAVQTDLARYLIGEKEWEQMKSSGTMSWQQQLVLGTLSKLILTVQEGASTQVFLASEKSQNLHGKEGQFFTDCKAVNLNGGATQDLLKAQELWSVSEQMTGINFSI